MFDKILFSLGAISVVGGLIGWYVELAAICPPMGVPMLISESIYRTLMLFFLEGNNLDIGHDYHYWTLHVSRIIAPLVTFGAIYRALSGLLAVIWAEKAASGSSGHLVIFGYGPHANAIAQNESGQSRVLLVENRDNSTAINSKGKKSIELAGDISEEELFKSIRLDRAKNIIVINGDDSRNLGIGESVKNWLKRSSGSRHRRHRHLEGVYVSVENRMLRQQTNDKQVEMCCRDKNAGPVLQPFSIGQLVAKPFIASINWMLRQQTNDKQVEMCCRDKNAGPVLQPFSIGQLVAKSFIASINLFEIADILSHTRIHMVFFGLSRSALELLEWILIANTHGSLKDPVLSVISADPESERIELYRHFPELNSVCSITFTKLTETLATGSEASLKALERKHPATAIFVCMDDDYEALDMALSLRRAADRHDCLRAPVFVCIENCAGVSHQLTQYHKTHRYEDVIQALCSDDKVLALDYIKNAHDNYAKKIHEQYRQKKEKEYRAAVDAGDHADDRGKAEELDHLLQTDDTLADWNYLQWKYKQSNRRQAHHLVAKLASMGVIRTGHEGCGLEAARGFAEAGDIYVARGVELYRNDVELEYLAELEHKSWMVGSYLEGWREGVRDDERLIHNCLKPYDLLPDKMKEYDIWNIELAKEHILKEVTDVTDPPDCLYRYDVWIGIIGTISLHPDAIEGLEAWVNKTVGQILQELPECHFTLVSPMAPGSDIVATSVAVAALKEHKVPFRLIIPDAVPQVAIVEAFRVAYEQGAMWVPGLDAAKMKDRNNWAKNKNDVSRDIESRVTGLIDADQNSRIVNIRAADPDFRRSSDCEEGFRRQNAYICRSHILLAAQGSPQIRPGGTAEALSWWKDPGLIPSSVPQYRQRPNKLASLQKKYYLHNVDSS